MRIFREVSFSITIYLFYCITRVQSGLSKLKIVGGNLAESIPYQVSFQSYNYHQCGGAIVKNNIILTAAHCIYKDSNPNLYSVRAGSNEHLKGGQIIPVVDYVVHPKYLDDGIHHDYDIAIAFLDKPLKFDTKVRSIDMIESNESIPSGVNAMISGWGVTSEDATNFSYELRFAYVPLVNQSICKDHVGSIEFTDRMVCAGFLEGGANACSNDSGGPLVANNKLIGIASAGDGCGQPNKLTVYANVAALRKWINNRIKEFNNSKKFFKEKSKSQ